VFGLNEKINMKTLVIHPKDSTTNFLSVIYSDKDWTVINTNTSKKILKEQIKTHDRIVMLGHGTEKGLIGFDRLVIDSTWVFLLREKICVCIWCNADVFLEKYGLKGYYTGMIISEYEEAIMCCVPTNSFWISESNTDFALAIKNSIDDENMLEKAKLLYEGNTSVVEFNRNNLYYEALS
jgi:hypothetical protein